MWRPAALRFGLVALIACGGSRAAEQQPLEHHGGAARSVVGSYACAIEDAGYRYPAFRCVIRNRAGGRIELVKLDGSQRFEGEVREGRGGLAFSGRFYCPWGDCTQDLHGVFAPDGAGGWKGTFRDARFVVWMSPAAAAGQFGGAGYGGEGYGGVGYGGAMVAAPPSN